MLLGSARLIRGQARAGFTFPAEQAFAFELPDEVAKTAVTERVEVTRVVAEATRGVVIGGLLTPLGLIQAIAAFVDPLGYRCGLAVIKLRFLRALQGLGVRLHDIQLARLIYPADGPAAVTHYLQSSSTRWCRRRQAPSPPTRRSSGRRGARRDGEQCATQ